MNDSWNAQLDQRLRDVAVPAGLVARLQEIAETVSSASDADLALWSDDALDEQLCQVELPEGFVDSLQEMIATAALNEEIDAQLRDVAIPHRLVRQLRTIPWTLRRRQLARLAVAAVWLILVGGGYYGGLAAWLSTFVPQDRTQSLAWINVEYKPQEWQLTGDAPEPVELAQWIPDSAALAETPVTIPVLHLDETAPPGRPGPAGELAALMHNGWQPWQDMLVLRWRLLGSPSDLADRLPPLESVAPRMDGGLRPPLVRGYDRQFLLTRGAHPVVSPDGHPDLRSVTVPLTVGGDSFERARQSVAAGRWPDAREMQVADFLAAMDYPLPATEPGKVGIRTAAGPSPLGSQGAQLLQVAIQAGPWLAADRPPVHLTVAIDVSTSMNLGNRLGIARRALVQLLDELGPEDQLSLLLFNDKPQYEVMAASRDEAAALREILADLEGSGGTNLAAAVQYAASLAMSEFAAGSRRHLALITDGPANLDDRTLADIADLLGSLRQQGLEWSLIDVGGSEAPDDQFLELAQQAEGRLRHPRTAAEGRWMLSEALAGQSTIIAADATLKVTFDPQAVAAYRLIGHAPTRLAGLDPDTVAMDLRAGQTVTGLFEVWLKANAHDDVAQAVLAWRDPSTGEERRRQQRISRLQFAPSFQEAALSLQASAVAAGAGEVLAQSPFALRYGLQEVDHLAARVNPRLAERSGFAEFVALVQAAERVRMRAARP